MDSASLFMNAMLAVGAGLAAFCLFYLLVGAFISALDTLGGMIRSRQWERQRVKAIAEAKASIDAYFLRENIKGFYQNELDAMRRYHADNGAKE